MQSLWRQQRDEVNTFSLSLTKFGLNLRHKMLQKWCTSVKEWVSVYQHYWCDSGEWECWWPCWPWWPRWLGCPTIRFFLNWVYVSQPPMRLGYRRSQKKFSVIDSKMTLREQLKIWPFYTLKTRPKYAKYVKWPFFCNSGWDRVRCQCGSFFWCPGWSQQVSSIGGHWPWK